MHPKYTVELFEVLLGIWDSQPYSLFVNLGITMPKRAEMVKKKR